METALKQRLLGAAVLVALAVTFLPMLVMDPAPESGASDVPLKVPAAPTTDIETREMPLVEPAAPSGPALAPVAAPSGEVDTPQDPSGGMFPAATAGGGYAVSFGSYANAADASRVVGALRASQLPGYADVVPAGERTLHRVRIGPYATQADAEGARLRAAHVRDDVGAKVVVLDAGAPPVRAAKAAAPATPPAPPPANETPARTVATAPRSSTAASAPPRPAVPAEPPEAETASPPAASSVGFAVQLGAFSQAGEAQRLQDRARAAGFSAFVEPVRTENGTLHRVRIGPVADRAAADGLRSQAAGKLGVSGIVRPHP